MASEINLKIKATSDAVPVIKGVEKEAGNLKTTVADLNGMLETFDGHSKAIKDDLTKLDAGIARNKQSLRDLGSAFADASKEADKLSIKAKMDQIQKDLNTQLKVKKIKLEELIEVDNSASRIRVDLDKLVHVDEPSKKRWFSSLFEGLSSGAQLEGAGITSAFAGAGKKWAAAAAGTFAPALISAAGAAISAGAGGVGIGGAVALAIRADSELQGAGKDLGMRLLGGLTQSAHTAFYEPIKATLKDLTHDVDTVSDQWAEAFEKLAPALRPFADDLADVFVSLSGVIADIAGDSGPALDALGDGLGQLGDSVGELLQSLTEDSEGNAEALREFFGVVSTGIDVVRGAVEIWQEYRDVIGPIEEALNPLAGLFSSLGDAMQDTGDDTEIFNAGTAGLSDAAEEATTQLNLERSALEGLSDALKAQTDPAFALIDAQQQLSKAQKDYNKAVKDHGENSAEAKEALIDLTKASLGMEGAAEKAAGTFDGQVTPALRATLKAAGMTDAQIDQVAKSFRGARAAGEKFEDKYVASTQVKNIAQTIDQISAAAAAARSFAKTYYARLSVAFSAGAAQKEARDTTHARATGGIAGQAASGMTSSGLTWVGEQGPELVDLPAGSRVWSNSDSMRSNTARPGGGTAHPAMPLVLKLMLDHRSFAEVQIANIQDYIANWAGGDIKVLTESYR